MILLRVPILGDIIDFIALLMGYIMQALFFITGGFNIGLCIILFTIIVRLIMMPMTIKQQRFSKLSAMMQPELAAIQNKYKGKNDTASMQKMQLETKAVYEKYGTSPTGSCLQLIIQMPILFALYRVIMNVPAYVKPVKELYLNVLYGLDLSQMKEFFGLNKLAKNLSTADLNSCIDAMSGYTRGNSSIKLQSGIKLQDILNVSDKAVASNSLTTFSD